MFTYQDFQKIAEMGEQAIIEFVHSAIVMHQSESDVEFAEIAEDYYFGENRTIKKYEHIITDAMGKNHVNEWKPNHKLTSTFFGRVVDQDVQYILGNGVIMDENQKEKLGKDFDNAIRRLARYAEIGGIGYGFWDKNQLKTFRRQEFVPLVDERTEELKSGIYFWRIAPEKPLRAILYEMDGYAEYVFEDSKEDKDGNTKGFVYQEKRPYNIRIKRYEAENTETVEGWNYSGFPIVPLTYNDRKWSELKGKRATVDALDLIESGIVNNADEGSIVYWTIQNAGAMDEVDDAMFLKKILTTHVAHVDDGQTAQPHQIEAPFQGNQAAVDMIYRKLYTDFQAFDSTAVSAGSQTATAIKACYHPQRMKANKFEERILDFLYSILEIAGITDAVPTFAYDESINKQEEINVLLSAASFLSQEFVTRQVLSIIGKIDDADEVLKQMQNEEMQRFALQTGMQEYREE